MTRLQISVKNYADGERTCRACGDPLPAHQTWPTSLWRWCSKEKCLTEMREGKAGASKVGRYVGASELKCGGPACENFVPEGRYDKRSERLYCSPACWQWRLTKGVQRLVCKCGCDEEFLGRASTKYREQYKNGQHRSAHRKEKYLNDSIGPFRALVTEYLEGFAKQRYTDTRAVRGAFGPFFRFLQEKSILSIEVISPTTITKYLEWAEHEGLGAPKRSISFLSVFFQWTIYMGHRKGANPVVPRFHGFNQVRKNPRPLLPEEADFGWQLLRERGNSMVRLFMALGEEAGLRISELARIRLEDVDINGRRVFVRNPTKNKKTRWANFSSKTVQCYAEWMAERDPACGHDFLFYNVKKGPPSAETLRRQMKLVLLKEDKGKKLHETGFDDWSSHRLRHSMASNLLNAGADASVIMAQGGWSSLEAMSAYLKVDPAHSLQSYDEAMRRHQEGKKLKPRKRSMDFNEYLSHTNTTAQQVTQNK
jgi:integrase/recombinase XerC